jgi:hypothetical protein
LKADAAEEFLDPEKESSDVSRIIDAPRVSPPEKDYEADVIHPVCQQPCVIHRMRYAVYCGFALRPGCVLTQFDSFDVCP